MPILLHDSQLTRPQRDIVELRPERHHLILGPPGSGKTQVLLHRASWMQRKFKVGDTKFRILVYTNVLKQFIAQSLEYLHLPKDCVQTFDEWCGELWPVMVGGRKPTTERLGRGGRTISSTDYEEMRRKLAAAVEKRSDKVPLLEFAMVDEGQDLTEPAYRILRALCRHVSVFADARQQIYETGLGVEQILARLNVPTQTASLLPAYRNTPDVAKLASYFGSPYDGLNFLAKDGQKPCLYVAPDWDAEVDQMASILRERMRLNQKACIIVPTNRDLYSLAKKLAERGLEVEKAIPPRRGAEGTDFNSLVPKIATYHSAKGLTFDCVLLPRLVENNFAKVTGARRQRLLLVGITRAIQWVYMSSVAGYELKEIQTLREAAAKGDVFVMPTPATATMPAGGKSATPPAVDDADEDDGFL